MLARIGYITVIDLVPADFDGDSDVDLDDHAHIQTCYTPTAPPPECENANLDGHLDVDANDLTLFLQCFSGAQQLPDPGCAN